MQIIFLKNLEFDLISSDIGDAIKISNINLPEGVKPTITLIETSLVATLAPPTVEAEKQKLKKVLKAKLTKLKVNLKMLLRIKKRSLQKIKLNKKTFTYFHQFILSLCGSFVV